MKGKRTNLESSSCGIARSLDAIGDWWSLLIVREAFKGHQRFGEFQKSLGAAKNILAARLKKLVQEGIFRIEPDLDSRLSHLYVLTPKGKQLATVLVALWQWGEENCCEPGELKTTFADRVTGLPIPRLEVRASDGREIGYGDFAFKPVALKEDSGA
nr:helix-turn-helix domain-containing protein [Rhizobium mesoamericanum]